MSYGILEAYNYYKQKIEDNIEDEEVIDKLDQKKLEIIMERKKRQAISAELNKITREMARDEVVIDRIREILSEPLDIPKFKELKLNENKSEWLLCFGDIHYDKFFESVNNKYSIEEVHKRFEILLNKLIIEINKNKIDKLTILNTGDSLEGLLRISAIKTLKLGMLESLINFSRFMASWLNELSKYVKITYYHVPTANHTEVRLFNQKRGETDENLEKIIVNYIHDLLRNNSRIKVPITTNKSYVSFKIFDYNLIGLHGDGIKNIKNSLKDFSVLHRKFYDYVIMGHFHSSIETTIAEGETNNMEILVTPSIVGSDCYSDTLFKGSKSSAKLHEFSESEGHITSKNLILN